MSNKKAQQVLKDLFIGCAKLNLSLYFLTHSYFRVSKDVRLNSPTMLKTTNAEFSFIEISYRPKYFIYIIFYLYNLYII